MHFGVKCMVPAIFFCMNGKNSLTFTGAMRDQKSCITVPSQLDFWATRRRRCTLSRRGEVRDNFLGNLRYITGLGVFSFSPWRGVVYFCCAAGQSRHWVRALKRTLRLVGRFWSITCLLSSGLVQSESLTSSLQLRAHLKHTQKMLKLHGHV